MKCITLSSGKQVCFDSTAKFQPGGKTLVVPNSSVKLPPLSKEQQLAQNARTQGDIPIAPAIANQQFRMREEEAVKKKLAKQPTIKLSEAQKKDIADYKRRHGLLIEDVLAEQMMRNKQSLSNPDDQSYLDDLQNVLGDAGTDIENNDFGILNAMLNVPTGLISGRYESPSQAIGRFALRNDANQLRNAMIDDQGNPTGLGMVTDFALPIGLEQAIVKGISNAPTILNNTYKYNPWAFKPQEGMMYRGLGKEGMEDAIQSGVFRPKQYGYAGGRSLAEKVATPTQFGSTFYAPAKRFGVVENYGPSYLAEVPFEGNQFARRYGKKDWSWSTPRQIPIEEGRILQKDWLRGYKPLKIKSTSATETLSPPHQMGFINLKGAFQKYPKGKLTQEEIEAFKNSSFYKKTTKEHLDNVNKFGDKWSFPNYAEETLNNAIKTGDRSIVNHTLYGGNNWSTNNYILAGLMGTAYPGVAALYGLTFSPPVVRNKVLNSVGITNIPGTLSSNDTTINITNTPMDFAKVNETKNGKVILGGEFIEDSNNTVRKAKDWATAIDTYSDQKYPSKDIQSFYGIENGKFKVGKASEFKPETEIVPRRFGATNISKAILNGKAMRLLDNKGNPIYQNTPNTGKFILYSPSTKEAEFNYINTGKVGVDKVNKFLKKNKDAQYIHLDNGRYEFYGLNPGGLSDQDFINYYEQDLKRKGTPGYNMIIKKDGGFIKAQKGLKVPSSGFNIPKSQKEILEEQARAQGDISSQMGIKPNTQILKDTKDKQSLQEQKRKAEQIQKMGEIRDPAKEPTVENLYDQDIASAFDQYSQGEFIDPTLQLISAPIKGMIGQMTGTYGFPSDVVRRFGVQHSTEGGPLGVAGQYASNSLSNPEFAMAFDYGVLGGLPEVVNAANANVVAHPGVVRMGVDKPHFLSPTHYRQVLKISNNISPSTRAYLEKVINTIEKQGGNASQAQFDILNRFKRGDFNFGPKGRKDGGKNINNTGYLDNSDTKHNPYNVIPSNNITMDGVSIPLLLMPDGDKARVVMPHSGEYNFPNSQYVTEIPLAQKGKKVYPQPTTQDSVILYNNQLLKDAFYKNNPNYKRVSSRTSNEDLPYIINEMDPNTLKRRINISSNGSLPSNYATNFNRQPNEHKSELEKRFKKLSNDVYSAGDILIGDLDFWFNPDAPHSYFSPTIKPKEWIGYISQKYGDSTDIPMYDAFEIKPFVLRTPEENVEWEKKYGTPQSKPNQNVREQLELEPLQSKEPPRLTSNFNMEPRSINVPSASQASNEEANRQYSIRIPTVDIIKRAVSPKGRCIGKGCPPVNPKPNYKRSIEFGSREIPIIDDYNLNKGLIKMGMEPRFQSGGKIIKLSTGKIIKIK